MKKRIVLFLTMIFVVVLLVGCNKTDELNKVTFKVDAVENVIYVESGNEVIVPNSPTKAGYKFVGWYLDEEEFDFTTKLETDTVLVAKFEELTKEELVYEFLTTIDYTNIIETGLDASLHLELGDVVTPYDPEVPSSALGAKIVNLVVDLEMLVDLSKLEVYVALNITFDGVQFIAHQEGEVVVMDPNWMGEGSINYMIALKEGILYSSLESLILINEEESSLLDVIEFAQMFMPEDIKEVLEQIEPILEDHKEFTPLVDLSEIEVDEVLNLLLNDLNTIAKSLIYLSPFEFSIDGNSLTVSFEDELEVVITLNKTEDNKFESLDATIEIEEISGNLNINTDDVLIEVDATDFTEVEMPRIFAVLALFL